MSATSEVDHAALRYGRHGIEAEYWIDELSLARPEALGDAVVRHGRLGELVVSAVDAGGSVDDIVDALVMAGAARKVVRLRDRLPVVRGLPTVRRRRHPVFEVCTG